MGKEIVNQVQEAQRIPSTINPRRNTPRHILIKLTNILQLVNGWTVVHPCYGILLSNKKESSYRKHNSRSKFECIMLSKRSQTQKASYCMIPFIWHSEKDKTTETEKRSVFSRSVSSGKEWHNKGPEVIFVLYLDYRGGCMTVCICKNS